MANETKKLTIPYIDFQAVTKDTLNPNVPFFLQDENGEYQMTVTELLAWLNDGRIDFSQLTPEQITNITQNIDFSQLTTEQITQITQLIDFTQLTEQQITELTKAIDFNQLTTEQITQITQLIDFKQLTEQQITELTEAIDFDQLTPDQLAKLRELLPNLFTDDLTLAENRKHNGNKKQFEIENLSRLRYKVVAPDGSASTSESMLDLFHQGVVLRNGSADGTQKYEVSANALGALIQFLQNGNGGTVLADLEGITIRPTGTGNFIVDIPSKTVADGVLVTDGSGKTTFKEVTPLVDFSTLSAAQKSDIEDALIPTRSMTLAADLMLYLNDKDGNQVAAASLAPLATEGKSLDIDGTDLVLKDKDGNVLNRVPLSNIANNLFSQATLNGNVIEFRDPQGDLVDSVDLSALLNTEFVYTSADLIRNKTEPTEFVILNNAEQSGMFVWDALSTDNEDGVNGSAGTIIKLSTEVTGRYKRIYDKGIVQMGWWGISSHPNGASNTIDSAHNSDAIETALKLIDKGGIVKITGQDKIWIGFDRKIILKADQKLYGSGRNSVRLFPSDTFSDDIFIQLGSDTEDDFYVLGCAIYDLFIDASVKPGVTGVYSNKANESSGAYRCSITANAKPALHIENGVTVNGQQTSVQNFDLDSLELYSENIPANYTMIVNAPNFREISNITAIGNGFSDDPLDNALGTILFTGGASGVVNGVHVEGAVSGITYDGAVFSHTLNGLKGAFNNATITNLVRIAANSVQNIQLNGLIKANAINLINDEQNNKLITSFVGYYHIGIGSVGERQIFSENGNFLRDTIFGNSVYYKPTLVNSNYVLAADKNSIVVSNGASVSFSDNLINEGRQVYIHNAGSADSNLILASGFFVGNNGTTQNLVIKPNATILLKAINVGPRCNWYYISSNFGANQDLYNWSSPTFGGLVLNNTLNIANTPGVASLVNTDRILIKDTTNNQVKSIDPNNLTVSQNTQNLFSNDLTMTANRRHEGAGFLFQLLNLGALGIAVTAGSNTSEISSLGNGMKIESRSATHTSNTESNQNYSALNYTKNGVTTRMAVEEGKAILNIPSKSAGIGAIPVLKDATTGEIEYSINVANAIKAAATIHISHTAYSDDLETGTSGFIQVPTAIEIESIQVATGESAGTGINATVFVNGTAHNFTGVNGSATQPVTINVNTGDKIWVECTQTSAGAKGLTALLIPKI